MMRAIARHSESPEALTVNSERPQHTHASQSNRTNAEQIFHSIAPKFIRFAQAPIGSPQGRVGQHRGARTVGAITGNREKHRCICPKFREYNL